MNCKNCRTAIDEVTSADMLAADILTHLDQCTDCRVFRAERGKLTQMLQNMQTINVPANFNFRVKALIRKQETTNAPLWTWHKTAFLIPSALAVLIIGFVIAQTFTPPQNALQTANLNLPSLPQTAQIPAPLPAPQDLSEIKTTLPTQINVPKQIAPREIALIQAPKPRLVRRETRAASAPLNLKRETEEIRSIDSHTLSVSPVAPSIMAPGFPDPVAKPRKQSGEDLLQTFGVRVASEIEGLRVVKIEPSSQGAKAGLEAGDVIKKINDEDPTAVSGNEFTEIKLVILRKEQTQEIRIVAKP